MKTIEQIKELDVVALLTDMPDERLSKGAIGTVVYDFGNGFYEVEFANLKRWNLRYAHTSGRKAFDVKTWAGNGLNALLPKPVSNKPFWKFYFSLARYNIDGSLDNSFGQNGRVKTYFPNASATPYSITISPDKKIVVAGDVSEFNSTDQNPLGVRYFGDNKLI